MRASRGFLSLALVVALGFMALAGCQTPRPAAKPAEGPDPNAGAYERVALASGDGTFIHGYLFKPAGPGPFPAVVGLHGCAGLFRKHGWMSAREAEWGKRLAAAGYVALYPDSFASRGLDEICTATEFPDFAKKVRAYDAYGALTWLQSQAYVKANRVALMGWSHGGGTLLWALDRNSPAHPTGLASDFRVGIAFYPGCGKVRDEALWSNQVPIEILIGERDDWTSARFCKALSARKDMRTDITVTTYAGAYHGFDAPSEGSGNALHSRAGIPTPGGGTRTVHYGAHPRARKQAVKKALAILKRALN